MQPRPAGIAPHIWPAPQVPSWQSRMQIFWFVGGIARHEEPLGQLLHEVPQLWVQTPSEE